jgi:hypothetical protein
MGLDMGQRGLRRDRQCGRIEIGAPSEFGEALADQARLE